MKIVDPDSAPIPTATRKVMILSYRDLERHGKRRMPSGAEKLHPETMAKPIPQAENGELEIDSNIKNHVIISYFFGQSPNGNVLDKHLVVALWRDLTVELF